MSGWISQSARANHIPSLVEVIAISVAIADAKKTDAPLVSENEKW